jgi:hypothetical protein
MVSVMSREGSIEARRLTEQGPYGSTYGNAIGQVWITGREIEIEVDDLRFVAGLLEDEAPLTCTAFLSILP